MYCASPCAADRDGDGAADAPLVQLCYAEVAFAYHVPPALAPAAATPAVGDARGGTAARSPAPAFSRPRERRSRAARRRARQRSWPAASDDARCRFGDGADPENGFSLEGTAAGHARVVAARALSDTALGGGVIGGSGNATTSVGVSASLNGGADWISDASAGGFAYALRTTLLRVAPRRVLATVVGVVGGVTTVTVDGAGGVNKPRLACVTSVLAPVTDDAAPDASFAAGTNNSSDDGDDESGLFTGENPAAFAPVALRAT